MNIRMLSLLDLLAIRAMIAAIHDGLPFLHWLEAVQSFGERARDRFQFPYSVPDKKIAVSQSTSLERALKQSDPLLLAWKIFKCHSLK